MPHLLGAVAPYAWVLLRKTGYPELACGVSLRSRDGKAVNEQPADGYSPNCDDLSSQRLDDVRSRAHPRGCAPSRLLIHNGVTV